MKFRSFSLPVARWLLLASLCINVVRLCFGAMVPARLVAGRGGDAAANDGARRIAAAEG